MTSQEQLIRARIAILAMAAELKNVARVCKLAGVSRTQFYAMKKAYETYGKEGLAPQVRRKPHMPNRTAAPLEERILLNTHTHPTISYLRLAGYMKSEGIDVTPTMVRYVWVRHGLSTRSARVRWVKRRNVQAGEEKAKDASHTLHGAHSAGYGTSVDTPSPLSVPDVG
jgi:transposase